MVKDQRSKMLNFNKECHSKCQENGPEKEHMKDRERSWQTVKSHLKKYGLFRNLSRNGVTQKPPYVIRSPLFCPIYQASALAEISEN
jgi:hypothetical protein